MKNDVFIVEGHEIGSTLMVETPLVSELLSDIVQLLYGLRVSLGCGSVDDFGDRHDGNN